MTSVIIFIIVAIATLALAFFGVLHATHKIPAIWIMFSSIVLYALASCLYWQQQVQTERSRIYLHFKVQNSIIGDKSNGGIFWVRYRSGLGDTLSPMPIAISLTITNTGPNPITVDTLTVDVREGGGKWTRLKNVPTVGQRVYFIYDDLKTSRVLDFSENGLQELMWAKKSITTPNQPLKGWVFFNRPTDFDNSVGKQVEFRFVAEDTTGTKYEEATPISPLSKEGRDTGEFSASPSFLKWTGVTEDLSALAIKPWPPYPN